MIENTVLAGLLHNEQYVRKVLPFLKTEYFDHPAQKQLYDLVDHFVNKYKKPPTMTALRAEVDSLGGINEGEYNDVVSLVDGIDFDPDTDLQWLIDTTEKFCQDKAIYNAVKRSISLLDDEEGASRGALPQILSDALAVSFDNSVGHDYMANASDRYDYYHSEKVKLSTGLDYLDRITRGGFERKTLNVLLAGTGVGKSLSMCSIGAYQYLSGKNVLYITLEMAAEKIAQRIDANLLDVDINDLEKMTREDYMARISKVKKRTSGNLIVREFPPASAGAGHFRHLLNELAIKKNFVPDVVYIDYINLTVSSRIKQGANVNSYGYIKAIAEEFRGLGVEFNLPIVTATQTTRSGFSSTDLGLEDTSESFGLPATADLFVALSSSDDLEQLGQIKVKQLKNRYGDLHLNRTFVVGVDRPKMRLFDVDESAQDLMDETALFDKTSAGQRMNNESPQFVIEDFK